MSWQLLAFGNKDNVPRFFALAELFGVLCLKENLLRVVTEGHYLTVKITVVATMETNVMEMILELFMYQAEVSCLID